MTDAADLIALLRRYAANKVLVHWARGAEAADALEQAQARLNAVSERMNEVLRYRDEAKAALAQARNAALEEAARIADHLEDCYAADVANAIRARIGSA